MTLDELVAKHARCRRQAENFLLSDSQEVHEGDGVYEEGYFPNAGAFF